MFIMLQVVGSENISCNQEALYWTSLFFSGTNQTSADNSRMSLQVWSACLPFQQVVLEHLPIGCRSVRLHLGHQSAALMGALRRWVGTSRIARFVWHFTRMCIYETEMQKTVSVLDLIFFSFLLGILSF